MQEQAWCKLLEMCGEVLSRTREVFSAVTCARALCKLEAEAEIEATLSTGKSQPQCVHL